MKLKPVLVLMLALSLGGFFSQPLLGNEDPELEEVVVTSCGNTPGEALEKALSEAVVAVAGAILGERSTLVEEDLKEELFQYSRGTVQTYDVLEEKTLERGFSVTLRVKVNRGDLAREAHRLLDRFQISLPSNPEEGRSSQEWMNLLAQQLDLYSYESFMNLKVLSLRKDLTKNLLVFSLELSFDTKLYEEVFVPGVMRFLDALENSPEFPALLEKEKALVNCHILESQRRSRSYSLPLEMADILARALGFSPQSMPRGAAFRRGWAHLSLVDEAGRELERIPLELPLTNTGAFLVKREALSTPERIFDSLGSARGKKPLAKSSEELVFAPSFGGATTSGSPGFFVRVLYPVSFELSKDLLEATREILPQFHLERW